MDPFHMHRLWGPTARFHQPSHVRPITVQQGKGVVKWQGIRGVFGERMKGENEDETCFGMGDISGAAKRGFQQWVAGHAAVGVTAIRWVTPRVFKA